MNYLQGITAGASLSIKDCVSMSFIRVGGIK